MRTVLYYNIIMIRKKRERTEKMKKKIHIKVLAYGLYAVLCHMCGVLLFYLSGLGNTPAELLTRQCGEMLEYSAMSLVIVAVGAFLLRYVTK